jgi:hypothetical protein
MSAVSWPSFDMVVATAKKTKRERKGGELFLWVSAGQGGVDFGRDLSPS